MNNKAIVDAFEAAGVEFIPDERGRGRRAPAGAGGVTWPAILSGLALPFLAAVVAAPMLTG